MIFSLTFDHETSIIKTSNSCLQVQRSKVHLKSLCKEYICFSISQDTGFNV